MRLSPVQSYLLMNKVSLLRGLAAGALASGLFLAWPAAAADAPAPAPKAKKAAAPAAKKGRTIKLFMRDGLRFEPPRFEARPGEDLVLEIENGDTTDMAHNFLLLKPGAREEVVTQALALADRGTARNWVPEHPAILLHTQLLDVNKVATLKLRVPDAEGIYPYVCTFPGHGMVMYGAIYAGVKMPALDQDPNIPPNAVAGVIAGGGRRPFVQRVFLPEAGPAAIAVALKGSQNVCWDAGECRLRYAWQGQFIDATQNWAGNGSKLAELPAKPWWQAPKDEFPLRFGSVTAPRPEVKFLGYATNPDGAEFRYRVDEAEVREQVLPRNGGPGLTLHVRVTGVDGPVFYHAPADANARWTSSAGAWTNNVLTLTAAQAADFTLTLTSALCTP
jgi:azurin